MTDEGNFKPEGYPEWDSDWREAKDLCKAAVSDVLGRYPGSVAHAVLAELLAEGVREQAQTQFEREWRAENDD